MVHWPCSNTAASSRSARVNRTLLIAAIVLGNLCIPASAQSEEPVALQAGVAAARFFGDLGDSDVSAAADVQLKTLFIRIGKTRLTAHLAFDLLLAWTTHDGDQFPYGAGADLSVRAFLFLPNLCWDLAGRTRVCAAIGQGTVNVNATGDRRDYGTWNYEIAVRQKLYGGLFAGLTAKYVGRVEQQVDGVDSQFSLATLSLGTGWVW